MSISTEVLARFLHEADRMADGKQVPWDRLSEASREERRVQARWLSSRLNISERLQPAESVKEAAERGFRGISQSN